MSASPEPSEQVAPDVVIPAGIPLRLQIPTAGFDSAAVVPASQKEPIKEWTTEQDKAANGLVDPGEPYDSALIYDTSVAGGGLFGTDVPTNGRIGGHTSRWDASVLGVFNVLQDKDVFRIGDPVAITTDKGLLCYTLVKREVIPKLELATTYDKYDKAKIVPDTVYLETCNRPLWWPNGSATDDNLFLTLRLDQGATNTGADTGSCW